MHIEFYSETGREEVTWETRADGKATVKLIIKAEDLMRRKKSGTARGRNFLKHLSANHFLQKKSAP